MKNVGDETFKMKAIITHNRSGFKNGMVLVDDEDYDWLNKYSWYINDGYIVTNIKINNEQNKKYIHRLIIGEQNKFDIDHIDHNKFNNCKNNLRIVNKSQNAMNKKSQKNSSSIFKGVSWNKALKKWKSDIKLNGKSYYLGYFAFEIDAAMAYNNKAKELFGEYAYLNKIKEN